MLTQWLRAASGTVTPTPAPGFNASKKEYGLQQIVWDGVQTWPRLQPDTGSTTLYDVNFDSVNGDRFWLLIGSTVNTIREFALNDTWYLGNVTLSGNLTVTSQDSKAVGFAFGNSGTRLYIAGQTNDLIYQYNLATAYRISTATYSKSLSLSSAGPVPYNIKSIAFNFNGVKMFVLAQNAALIQGVKYPVLLQYSMTTPWDIGTARFDGTNTYPRINNGQIKLSGTSYANARGIHTVGNNMYTVGSGSTCIVDYSFDTNNGIGNVYIAGTFTVSSQDSSPHGVFVSASKHRAYMIGQTTDRIYQYNFNTVGSVSSLTYSSKSINIGSTSVIGEGTPTSLTLSNDGTKVYFAGRTKNLLYQVALGTAYELDSSPLSGGGNTPELNTLSTTSPRSLQISPDGTVLFVMNSSTIWQYNLSTPWVISSAVYSGVNVSTLTFGALIRDFWVIDDGSFVFLFDSDTDKILACSMNAWNDLGSLSLYYTPAAPIKRRTHFGFEWNNDGTKLFTVNQTNSRIEQYNVLVPYDSNWAIFQSSKFINVTQVGAVTGMTISPDGRNIYVTGQGTGRIVQFVLKNLFDLSGVTATRLLNTPTTLLPSAAFGVFVRSNGTEIYVFMQGSPNKVVRLTLSTPWNISTASKVFLGPDGGPLFRSLNYTAAIPYINGIGFSSDGRNLYIVGQTGTASSAPSKLARYYLSTPWEITTAALSQVLFATALNLNSINTSAAFTDVTINSDGTVLYISVQASNPTDCIIKVTLPTPFSLTGATVADPRKGQGWYTIENTNPITNVRFKPDGTKYYIGVDAVTDNVIEYSMSSAYSIQTSTAGTPKTFTNGSTAISWNQSGTQLYVLSANSKFVDRYQLTTAWNVATTTYPVTNTTNTGGLLTTGAGWFAVSSFGKMKFNTAGTKFYVLETNRTNIREYTCSTAWQVNTATAGTSVNMGQGSSLTGFDWSYDGSRLYLTLATNSTTAGVIEMKTSSPFQLTGITFLRKFLTNPELLPQGVWMSSDGSMMYVVGNTLNTIRHYSLSIPFNVGSATLTAQVTMASDQGGTSPRDIIWASHGRRFLVVSAATGVGASIHEYLTSSEFAASTAVWQRSFTQFSYSTLAYTVRGIEYNDDGKKLYVVNGDSTGRTGHIYTYRLAN